MMPAHPAEHRNIWNGRSHFSAIRSRASCRVLAHPTHKIHTSTEQSTQLLASPLGSVKRPPTCTSMLARWYFCSLGGLGCLSRMIFVVALSVRRSRRPELQADSSSEASPGGTLTRRLLSRSKQTAKPKTSRSPSLDEEMGSNNNVKKKT